MFAKNQLLIYNKRLMGHNTHLWKQFKSLNKYDYFKISWNSSSGSWEKGENVKS